MNVIDANERFLAASARTIRQRLCEMRVQRECALLGWDRHSLTQEQMEGVIVVIRSEDRDRHTAAKHETERFVSEYCESRGWDRHELDLDQLNVMRACDGYELAKWRPSELPNDLAEVERQMKDEKQ